MHTICTHCGTSLDVPDHYDGRSVRCTSCAQSFVAERKPLAQWGAAGAEELEQGSPVHPFENVPMKDRSQPTTPSAPVDQDGLPPMGEKPDTSLLEGYASFLVIMGCLAGFGLIVAALIIETWVYALVGVGIIFATFLQHSAIQLFCRQSRELQAARQEIRWLIQQAKGSHSD